MLFSLVCISCGLLSLVYHIAVVFSPSANVIYFAGKSIILVDLYCLIHCFYLEYFYLWVSMKAYNFRCKMTKLLIFLLTGVKAVDKVKAFYDSCMRLEHKGEEDGLKAIIKKYGPWPMDDGKWNPKKWNFNRKLIDISTALPVALLFSASVQLDKKDPEIHVFQVAFYDREFGALFPISE